MTNDGWMEWDDVPEEIPAGHVRIAKVNKETGQELVKDVLLVIQPEAAAQALEDEDQMVLPLDPPDPLGR